MLGVLPLLVVVPGAATGTSSVAPRNGLLAVLGPSGISLVEPDGSAVRLVPGTEEMSEPAWSPDGSLLAMTGFTSADAPTPNVYTVEPDGSDRQLVLENAQSPSWSPDGKRLVVVRDGCSAPYTCGTNTDYSTVLVTVGSDGSDIRQLTSASGSPSEPEWSPDGRWIGYVDTDGAVELLSADGSADGVRSIADQGANLASSPDSSSLAFEAYQEAGDEGASVIVVVDLGTSKRTTLPGRQSGASAPAWSPDGKQLAFLSLRASPLRESTCGHHLDSHLWVMNTDGTKAHRVIEGTYYSAPSWAPSLEPQAKPTD